MDTKTLLERRRAALQEAQAIEAWQKGRIDDTALLRELRRAEQTRLRCNGHHQGQQSQNTPPPFQELRKGH